MAFHPNIELIQGKIEDLKRLKADVVFVSFKQQKHKSFSLLKEIRRETLEFWLKEHKNLVIQLPKNCDISELAILFHDFFELHHRFFLLKILVIYIGFF